MRYVIDASVALRWVLEEEAYDRAESVLRRVLELPEFFAVPELFGFEVLSVLSRLHPEPYKAFSTAITPVLQSRLLRYPLTEAIVDRSKRFILQGLTGYDAAYAALAEELEGCWITFDVKAAEKVGNSSFAVNLFDSLPTGWEEIQALG